MKPCHHSFLLPQGNYSLTSQKAILVTEGTCAGSRLVRPCVESSSAYPVPDLNRCSPP